MRTATPSRPSSGPSVDSTTPWRRRIAKVYAGEPEVGLGLATTGREEQQLHPRLVLALRSAAAGSVSAPSCIRMNASWNGRHDAAIGPDAATSAWASSIVTDESEARAAATCGRDALVAHHPVHELEAPQRLGIGGDVLQPVDEPLVRLPRLPQHHLGGLLQVGGQRRASASCSSSHAP